MKRTELVRRTPLRAKVPDATPKPAPGSRKRRCSNCGEPFQPARMGQQVCGVECSKSFARRIREQQERKADRERKQAMKTRQQWLKEAQVAFNSYIRERDAALPCISCGRHHEGSYDAGHYRSVGAMPALRFEELNVHKQCVPCNQHKAGNIVEYRIRLVERIGLALVEWLEQDHPPAKFTIEDAQRIKAHYQRLVREMKRNNDA